MATVNAAPSDIEATAAPTVPANTTTVRLNRRRRRRRRRHRPSVTASSETTTDGSFQFSDTEDDSRSMHSQRGGGGGGGESCDECSFSTETEGISVISGSHRHSSHRGGSFTFSDDDVKEEREKEVDLESGELELKVHRKREKRRECRICHLSLCVIGNGNSSDRRIIELGCSCKGDLGSAHSQCAETWFKIRGNTTCEICGTSATNIAGEQPIDTNVPPATSIPLPTALSVLPENRSFWHGRRVMNFLLACMIFAFIISWLFHFHILP